jgi:NADPH:quinone reductase-like Zn-dependent oxidoreductase
VAGLLRIITPMPTQPPTLRLPRKPSRADWLIPAGLILLATVPTLGGAIRLIGLARNDVTLPDHARFASAPVAASLHIVGATLFAFLGALQFAPRFRRRSPGWHRAAGWALAPLGVMGALAGIWLTLFLPPAAHDGPALTAIRLVAGSAWAAFIALGVLAIFRRDYAAHGTWMTRAYGLGLAGGTQVFTLMPWMLSESLQNEAGRAAMMGAGWVINAIVAEFVIRRRAQASRWGLRPQTPASDGPSMQAVLHDRYGGPELLRVGRASRPVPAPGQVLIRVHAASINAMDYRIMRADPFLVRLQNGFMRPKRPILGADLAGVIEAVGPGVTTFAIGDEVFGQAFFADGLGAFAEYVCVRKEAIIKKPASLGFIEAAALPLAGVTALQAVRDRAKLCTGQSVLIQGAGGGVGCFLVQIAKAYGAKVTAVCGPRSVELVRSLGADRVIDYTEEDFAKEPLRYDVVFGVNGYRPLALYRSLLVPGGVYVMVGGAGRQILEALLFGKLQFLWSGRRMEVLTVDELVRDKDLEEIRELLGSGGLSVTVDRVFPLARAAEAIRYVEGGHVRGKAILEVCGG